MREGAPTFADRREAGNPSPWLLEAPGGIYTFRGRARFPEHAKPPARFGHGRFTWEPGDGDVWLFVAEAEGNRPGDSTIGRGESEIAYFSRGVMDALWAAGCRAARVDGYHWQADDEGAYLLNGGTVLFEDESRPEAPTRIVSDRGELADTIACVHAVFGEAVELGEWKRGESAPLAAEVARFTPAELEEEEEKPGGAGDTFTCPGCGVSRSLEVVRAALRMPGVIACWMVSTSSIPALALGVAVAAAQAEHKGEVRLPPHLRPAGCALLWCTVVEGRRVFAAEAEELAELVEEVEAPAAGLCPWLTTPPHGRLVVEGRAALPDGYPLPEEVEGLAATWRRMDGQWAFRLEGDGTVEDLWNLVLDRWPDGHPRRYDVLHYNAPAGMVEGEYVEAAEILFDEEGAPCALSLTSDVEGDTAEVEAAIKRVFGGALELGDWTRSGDEWVAPVTRLRWPLCDEDLEQAERLTPAELWDRYLGRQSPAEWRALTPGGDHEAELGRYLATHPDFRVSEAARAVLVSKLVAYLADDEEAEAELVDVPFDEARNVTSIHYRLAPIDVGFDVRGEGVEVELGGEAAIRVSYATRSGDRRVVEGPRHRVVAHLRAHGYAIAEEGSR